MTPRREFEKIFPHGLQTSFMKEVTCLLVYWSIMISLCGVQCAFACLSMCLSVCLFVCTSVCLSVHLSVCLSVCQIFIYFYTSKLIQVKLK